MLSVPRRSMIWSKLVGIGPFAVHVRASLG
jgi:hypothetical protein